MGTQIANPNPLYPHDEEYFEILAGALRVCARYKPMFGQGRAGGLTLAQFRQMYGADPFYSWLGLDTPMMYAAHKAAGGMTSIYRQVGMGGQWVFNKVLQNTLGLTHEQANWTYTVPDAKRGTRNLSLDGRIVLEDVADTAARDRVRAWMEAGLRRVLVDHAAANAPKMASYSKFVKATKARIPSDKTRTSRMLRMHMSKGICRQSSCSRIK